MGILPLSEATIYYAGSLSGDVSGGSITSGTIQDGNPANLTVNTMTVSGMDPGLANLTVNLDISGGMNNGLYGYLIAPNGVAVMLINQPGYAVDGFGATGSGMNISLVSSGGGNGNIQSETSGSALSGTYNSAASFTSWNGIDPNGTWTLYFSDTIAGGGNATLNGWSLDMTSVPEPVNVALGMFAVFALGASVIRRRNSAASDAASEA